MAAIRRAVRLRLITDENEHRLPRFAQAVCDEFTERMKSDHYNMIGEIFELAFHDPVLSISHYIVARKHARKPRNRESADQQRGEHGQQHEHLLRLIEVGKVTECRDEIDPVPNRLEHLVKERGIGLIEQDQPGGGAAKQQNKKADCKARAVSPFANANDSETRLIDTVDPHLFLE
ncbi:hypothetical protein [Paraburkholderia sp. GAS448]|uniref:hypothetical protein n=1 Tax=Paraburkholderia sp. GAS448 TaxID=3035136 RepID=UPI003D206CDB